MIGTTICPTCWLVADLIPAASPGGMARGMARSRCPRGHENTLVPAVLAYLNELLGPAFAEID